MTIRKRLTILLGIDKDTYLDYESHIKNIEKYYKNSSQLLQLPLNSYEADMAYKWIYEKNVSLVSLGAKNKDKSEYFNDFDDLLKLQKTYFEEKIERDFMDNELKTVRSPSDVHIKIQENKNRYSIYFGNENKIVDVFANILHNMESINSYINETLSIVFVKNDTYRFENLKLDIQNPYAILPTENNQQDMTSLDNIINEAIEVYEKTKENYKSLNKPQNKNPYMNLFIYIKNGYLKNFYYTELPEKDYFEKYRNHSITILPQTIYTLKDVSRYLDMLEETGDEEQTYQKIQRLFHKRNLLTKYKEYGDYAFPEIFTPLSYYLYYSNRTKPIEDIEENNDIIDSFISERIFPIVKGIIENNLYVVAIFQYIGFIKSEMTRILNSYNHSYQDNMLNFLQDTVQNIYFRVWGFANQDVYSITS